jgi:hypothetical protein
LKINILSSFYCKYQYPYECLGDILRQKIKVDNIFMLEDGNFGDDGYKEKFYRLAKRAKVKLKINEDNKGEAHSRISLIEMYLNSSPSPEDIVVWFDGDDTFASKDSINDIVDCFDSDDVKFVFGKIKNWNHTEYSKDSFSPINVRSLPWACSPPRCFRAELLLNSKIEKSMFTVDGEFLKSATDQALMYELIEQNNIQFKNIKYTNKEIMNYRIHENCTVYTEDRRILSLKNEKLIRDKKVDYYV